MKWKRLSGKIMKGSFSKKIEIIQALMRRLSNGEKGDKIAKSSIEHGYCQRDLYYGVSGKK